MLNKLFRTK